MSVQRGGRDDNRRGGQHRGGHRDEPQRSGWPRLPVTEFLFDRPGAASPFGDDQTFPLPVSALAYRHPTS